MSDLWQAKRRRNLQAVEPLAVRMRPRRLDEYVGQEHILGEDKLLRRMLEADRITSLIFYGPPGTGKTALAELIAVHSRSHFERANAAAVGVKDIRQVLEAARQRLADDQHRTILFLDEIHRFNRAQQDVLLRDVERGVITLIGATTENPFFAINSPLVSRSQIFQFEPLIDREIEQVIRHALSDTERGFGELDITITEDAITHWAKMSDGDARRALMALEIAVLSSLNLMSEVPAPGASPGSAQTSNAPEAGKQDTRLVTRDAQTILINLQAAQQSIQRKAIVYDGTGDEHYDVASALIKSMRGSDPDAAIYWLAKMLEAGEDPRFIARRIAILASEDIGNADPGAIRVAAAAYDITERIGMPECQLTLGQAVIYMATAPKSNASANAIWSAMKDVKENRTVPVPRHLRDAHYAGAKKLRHGQEYQYAHDSPDGFVDQEYLGVDRKYYHPTKRGDEKRIGEYLKWIEDQRAEAKSQERGQKSEDARQTRDAGGR